MWLYLKMNRKYFFLYILHFSHSDDTQDASVLLLVRFLFEVSQVHFPYALVASLSCLFREGVYSLVEARLAQSRCQMAVCWLLDRGTMLTYSQVRVPAADMQPYLQIMSVEECAAALGDLNKFEFRLDLLPWWPYCPSPHCCSEILIWLGWCQFSSALHKEWKRTYLFFFVFFCLIEFSWMRLVH